jgi:Domain of unknown function (DUF4386)
MRWSPVRHWLPCIPNIPPRTKPYAGHQRPAVGLPAYQSRLVPRVLPVLGFIEAPLLNHRVSAWSAIAALPIALWELALGIWLVVNGFQPSPITADLAAVHAHRRTPAAVSGPPRV